MRLSHSWYFIVQIWLFVHNYDFITHNVTFSYIKLALVITCCIFYNIFIFGFHTCLLTMIAVLNPECFSFCPSHSHQFTLTCSSMSLGRSSCSSIVRIALFISSLESFNLKHKHRIYRSSRLGQINSFEMNSQMKSEW